MFGLCPQRGCLSAGSDADLALCDPYYELTYGVHVAQHRTDYNLYEGWQLKGFPRQVFLRGKRIVADQQWFGKAGSGRYLMAHPGEIL